MTWRRCAVVLTLIGGILAGSHRVASAQEPRPVEMGDDGRLVYHPDANGNRVPDFSHCGYASGVASIPFAPARVVVQPAEGDSTARIQAALDHVATLPADKRGLRGAVVLQKGVYEIAGHLRINAPGVVLRGHGMDEQGTTLLATGTSRRTIVQVEGADDQRALGRPIPVHQAYTPVGSMQLTVADTSELSRGDRILIRRPSTESWISAIGTDNFGGDRHSPRWHEGSRDLVWDRTIIDIDHSMITLNSPLTTAIDVNFGGAIVTRYEWPGRLAQVGIENLRMVSGFDGENRKDEAHAWFAITMQNVEDAWVRRVTMKHFAGGAVALSDGTQRITVEDCMSLDPVSETAGFRRVTFSTSGQLNLFQRCYSENGRHDFSAGFAAGPNAFVQCEAREAQHFSGGIGSWASGVLYDNVRIDGNVLGFGNLSSQYAGAGWAAANSVLWQCSASVIRCYSPPTAQNWAFGCWGRFEGNGYFAASNEHIRPLSLYYAQLADRLGRAVEDRAHLKPIGEGSTTSPSLELAAQMTAAAEEPAATMRDWIVKVVADQPLTEDLAGVPTLDALDLPVISGAVAHPGRPLVLRNGWLTIDDAVVVGRRIGVPWWRGGLTEREMGRAQPAVTRFVPGREGLGLTDNLDEMTTQLAADGIVALEHNYGLWYDRRRDDHQRVRRMDGDAWAPFYEQPFARSGSGTAWDGLSKYDLTRYNPWYWSRLREFVTQGERKGLVLLHNHYFQHNILEAGAHWVDSPWRPANAIQDTGFPEPPPFAGDKRIFLAEQFYDVSHPVRRELHAAFMRQCVANFSDQLNVIHLLSAEYTGPLHFMEFWLDTIAQWQSETGQDAMVALSATRDVQDAILADPQRSQLIDVIDVRYWWYQPDGSEYAPQGGRNLAPRQHARLVRPKPPTFDQVIRAVREYRERFPGKAVIYSADGADLGWAVLLGGGSLASLPSGVDPKLLRSIPSMSPAESADGSAILADPDRSYLAWVSPGRHLVIEATESGKFTGRWLDVETGQVMAEITAPQQAPRLEYQNPTGKPALLWLEAIPATSEEDR